MIDVTYGNVTQATANAMAGASFLGDDYPAGATEPWIGRLLECLVVARNARRILETGCFLGHTSQLLLRALHNLGGGDLLCCEIDSARAAALECVLAATNGQERVRWQVRNEDAITVIRSLPDLWLDFAFVDDDHTADHVAAEIEALLPKMAPNGIIAFHDVYGVCDLQRVVAAYGGYSLDFPRCGPAGGLGLLQVR